MPIRVSLSARFALLCAAAVSIAACGTLPRTSPTPPPPAEASSS